MFRGCDHLWRAWRSSATQTPGETTVVGLEMKPVGEPYAGTGRTALDLSPQTASIAATASSRPWHSLICKLQRIPVKLTRSRRGGSSCDILHEKVSVRKHRHVGIE